MSEELLSLLEKKEKELQFDDFNSETAINLGFFMIEKAKKERKKITIDISKNGQQLFHYSFDGTSPANDDWIIRKNRVVNKYFMSSRRLKLTLEKLNTTLEELHKVSSFDYPPVGGAFPLIVKKVGIVGTIAVSGLSPTKDHNMVVESIKEFLEIKGNNIEINNK